MIGAIIGDIAGSRFEWHNIKTKEFDLLTHKCSFTDDTVMSLAICEALMRSKTNYSDLSEQAVICMQEVGRPYPDCGYGGHFRHWMYDEAPKPYNSFGNGAAMRVSGCGYAADSIEAAKKLSYLVTAVTHNHPEGLKGAEATAVAVYMARTGSNMMEIRDYINANYYPMDFTLADIRAEYTFDVTCQGSVPQALQAFFESTSFEDAIRNAISIGGDSDTIAAITGGIAEAYYGVPTSIRKHALTFLDERLLGILVEFENLYPPKMEKVGENGSVGFEAPADNKVKIGGRAEMMQSAMAAADKALENSASTPEETTSQRLFAHLFEACNILRGPINQDEFKSYVTPILFFKRLSDVYDEETQVALEDSGGDEEYAAFPENHRFIIPDGCHWRDVRETSENVGVAIVNAMNGIERANPDTLSGVFSSFDDANWTDKAKLSDARLKNLVEHMSKLKVGNSNYSADVMGDAYEFLIKKFADLSKKNAGEFYTPRSIVKLLVMLLAPQPGETVYDPAAGTGGMLIEAIRYMKGDKLTYGRIYGQEKNLATSAIARMNLFLHGAKDFKVTQGDTLRSPNYQENGQLQKFNCVIANEAVICGLIPEKARNIKGTEKVRKSDLRMQTWLFQLFRGIILIGKGGIKMLKENAQMTLDLSPYQGLYEAIIPQNHILRKLKDNIDFSFVNPMLRKQYCEHFGRPAKEPEMMFKLLFLKKLYDLSDERLISSAQTDMAYKYFLGLSPEDKIIDPSLLAKFRKTRITEDILEDMLRETIQQAIQKGLVKSGTIIVDATHVEAAVRPKSVPQVLRELTKKLRKEIYKHEYDLSEKFPDKPSLEADISEEIAYTKELLSSIQDGVEQSENEEIKKIYQRIKELLDTDQIRKIRSKDDEDARFGHKTPTKKFFGYKTHLAMSDDRIITGIEVTDGAQPDGLQLPELIEKSKKNGVDIKEIIGDMAYVSDDNLGVCEKEGVILYARTNSAVAAAANTELEEGFSYNKDAHMLQCPAGHLAIRVEHRKASNGNTYAKYCFSAQACKKCPLREQCKVGKSKTYTYNITQPNAFHKARLEFESSEEFKKKLDVRHRIEEKNGEMKTAHGFQRADSVGLVAMRLQAYFTAIVVNMKRIVTVMPS